VPLNQGSRIPADASLGVMNEMLAGRLGEDIEVVIKTLGAAVCWNFPADTLKDVPCRSCKRLRIPSGFSIRLKGSAG